MISKDKITQRFISYVTIDTQSDPKSTTTPSTKKQWDLANLLVEELKEIGLQNISIDDKGYTYAKRGKRCGIITFLF